MKQYRLLRSDLYNNSWLLRYSSIRDDSIYCTEIVVSFLLRWYNQSLMFALVLYSLSKWENQQLKFLPTSSDISHTVPPKWDACVCLVCRLCSPWCINWLNAFTKITFVAALVITAAIFCCFSMFNPPLTHSLTHSFSTGCMLCECHPTDHMDGCI